MKRCAVWTRYFRVLSENKSFDPLLKPSESEPPPLFWPPMPRAPSFGNSAPAPARHRLASRSSPKPRPNSPVESRSLALSAGSRRRAISSEVNPRLVHFESAFHPVFITPIPKAVAASAGRNCSASSISPTRAPAPPVSPKAPPTVSLPPPSLPPPTPRLR